MNFSTLLNILSNATKRLPQLRFAWGLLGIAIVASIILGLFGSGKASIMAISISIIGTILVFVASIALSRTDSSVIPALILVWSITVFFVTFLTFTVSVFITDKPCNWGVFIGILENCRAAPLGSERSMGAEYTDSTKIIAYEGDLLALESDTGRAVIAFDPSENCISKYEWKYLSSYFSRWVQGYGEVANGLGYSYSFERRQRKPLEPRIIEAGEISIKSECRDKKSILIIKNEKLKNVYLVKNKNIENYEFYLSEHEMGNPEVQWACHCFLNNTDSKIIATFSPSSPVGNSGTFDSQIFEPKQAFNRCGPIQFVIGYEIFTGNPKPERNPFHHLGGLIWPTLDQAKSTEPFTNCSASTFEKLLANRHESSGFWVIDYKLDNKIVDKSQLRLFDTTNLEL